MYETRKTILAKKRKSQRRRRRFLSSLLGVAILTFGLLGFYYFYQESQAFSTTHSKPTLLRKEVAELYTASKTVTKQLKDTTDHQIVEAQKFHPRLNLDPKNINLSYTDLSQTIDQQILNSGFSGSVIVIKDNQLVLEKGYGYANKKTDQLNTYQSQFMIGSLQKQFTAVLIMKLVEQKLLTLETPVADFYPDLPNAQSITIRQLLSMTSGYSHKDYDKTAKDEQDAIDYTLNNLIFTPSSKWAYSSTNYVLLAGIIRQLTKGSYQDYFQKEIIDALQLTHTGFFTDFDQKPDKAQSYNNTSETPLYQKSNTIIKEKYLSEIGTGNVYSTVADLVTFYHALLDQELLTNGLLQDMWTPASANFNYTYRSGMYHRDSHLESHGLLYGYEPTIFSSYDGSNTVITLGNYYLSNKGNVQLTTTIFQLINQ